MKHGHSLDGVSRCQTCAVSDTDTCNHTELYDFFSSKLLNVSTCQCPCLVRCPYPCFVPNHDGLTKPHHCDFAKFTVNLNMHSIIDEYILTIDTNIFKDVLFVND